MVAFLSPCRSVIVRVIGRLQMRESGWSPLLKSEVLTAQVYKMELWRASESTCAIFTYAVQRKMQNKSLHWGFNWEYTKLSTNSPSSNYDNVRLFKLRRTKRHRYFHSPSECGRQSSHQLLMWLRLKPRCPPSYAMQIISRWCSASRVFVSLRF